MTAGEVGRKIYLERVGIEAAPLIQGIIEDAPRYTRNTDGVEHDPDGGRDILTALPPGCSMDQKLVLVINDDNSAIGVIDFIRGYPDGDTGFIGLFLLRESCQGNQQGRMAYSELERLAHGLGCRKLRLAVVDSNPVQKFWEKMGFTLTGDVRPHEGKNLVSTKRTMEKRIEREA